MTALSVPSSLDGISLHRFLLDDDSTISEKEAFVSLSESEIKRGERFHFERDRLRYIRGRGMVRKLLAEAMGQAPSRIAFEYGENGKPYLTNREVEFNLSHTEDFAILAISRRGPIGIDVEYLDRKIDFVGLSETTMSDTEQEVLRNAPLSVATLLFYKFWTAKESRMKLDGSGMMLPPQSISLKLKHNLPVGFVGKGEAGISIAYPIVHSRVCCCLSFLSKTYFERINKCRGVKGI